MDYPKIKKYLEGKTKGKQSEQIKNWLIDPSNEIEVRKILGEIWTNSKISLTGDKPDFDFMLKKLHYRILSEGFQSGTSVNKKKSSVQSIYQIFSRVAAILFIPLLVSTFCIFYYFRFDVVFSENSVIREVHTKPGTRINLELPDGTFVWLNDATTLKYPEKFTGNTRQVYVDGEAYFEVKSNPEKPFIVENPMMNTIVTGTSFNLNAYDTDHFFEVTLLEGKIHLEGQAGNIEVLPGRQIQFDTTTKRLFRNEVDPQNSIAWINGKLIIHNEKLILAIKKLSRWYNVEIQIDDPELINYELTCTLENEKIDQCLDLISRALPIQFEIKEDKQQGQTHYKIQLMRK